VTTSHIFYIPLVLLAGLVLGVLLGRRSLGMAAEENERREARRAARRRQLGALDEDEAGSKSAPASEATGIGEPGA
jgi:hypothetical protein